MKRRHQCPPTIDLFAGSGIFLELDQDDADETEMLDLFEKRAAEMNLGDKPGETTNQQTENER